MTLLKVSENKLYRSYEKDLRSVALLRCQVPHVKIGKPRRHFMKGSELFDDDAENEFPRFNSSELELGNLLGTISFNSMVPGPRNCCRFGNNYEHRP